MEKTFERTKNGSKPGPRESDLLVELQVARELSRRDRKLGWAALNRVFRAGSLPQPLSGEYAGELVAVRVAPLLTQLVKGIASLWMPWKGKAFDASRREGINILSRDSLVLTHLIWPLYRDYREIGPHFYRAFPFATNTAPGLTDPDRRVFKIDYNLEPNSRMSVRRVLDELVQLSEDFYLGKAHVKWWWGRWQTVAFFSLKA